MYCIKPGWANILPPPLATLETSKVSEGRPVHLLNMILKLFKLKLEIEPCNFSFSESYVLTETKTLAPSY